MLDMIVVHAQLPLRRLANLLLIQSALVTYVTAGYPKPEDTPNIMMAMQKGGAGTDCQKSWMLVEVC